MTDNNKYDVIIVGGSYSGLAAGMTLGRSLKNVLIIDDGKPCNKQTPQSNNFLTNDGESPANLAEKARQQVARYKTVKFLEGRAISSVNYPGSFGIEIETGEQFNAEKVIFATGIYDLLPGIEGLNKCWGISVLHCPYCHGYEVRNETTGILANGDHGFDFARLISNWTNNIVLFTNEPSTFTSDQLEKLRQHHIQIIDAEIARFEHTNGYLHHIIFKDGTGFPINVVYSPGPFKQHCSIPEQIGCALTEEGYIQVDQFQETSIKGIYAVGDNASKMRTLANAVAAGTTAGIAISKAMILDKF